MVSVGRTLGIRPMVSCDSDIASIAAHLARSMLGSSQYTIEDDALQYHCDFTKQNQQVLNHAGTMKSVRSDRIRLAALLAKQDAELLQLSAARWDTVEKSITHELMYMVCEKYAKDKAEAQKSTKKRKVSFVRQRNELMRSYQQQMLKLKESYAHPLLGKSSSSYSTHPAAAGAHATPSEDDGEGIEEEDDRDFIVNEIEAAEEEEATEEEEDEEAHYQ
jgi:hypothetical protein